MTSRYIELSRTLTAEIAAGKYAIGSSLPSEVELAEIYGVSRATLRSALEIVQELGLISRRKRVGIRIEASKPKHAYEQSLSSIEDLVQFATVTERHVQTVGTVAVDEATAALLGCAASDRWMKVELLRTDPRQDGLPICWTTLYLEAKLASGIRRKLHSSEGLVCEMVEEKFGRVVDEVRQDIRATLLPRHLAEKLAAPANSAALQITRRYVDERAATFQLTISTFPADRFTYSLALRRHAK